MRRVDRPPVGPRRGFTLVELLVVLFIVLLISAVALPVIVPALTNRQIGEAGRVLQAALAGARDAAIHANAPRGLRLLPDPTLSIPPGPNTPGVLTFNRMVQIEPAPDYSEGRAQITGDGVIPDNLLLTYNTPYPKTSGGGWTGYPMGYNPATLPVMPTSIRATGKVLRLEESAFYIDPVSGAPLPNSPTGWWWNIRLGDRVRIGDTGAIYTVVGPLRISGAANPELYVNNGPAADVRTTSPIQRTYSGTGASIALSYTVGVEFLYLVNGQDDDGDGFVDEGWDNYDNDFNGAIDDSIFNNSTNQFGEWETETWLGTLARYNDPFQAVANLPYTIMRRPVVSPGARETTLPGTVVIDATTWNIREYGGVAAERSRLPIDRYNHPVDIMLNQNGQLVSTPATISYSSPTAMTLADSFLHFWLADRDDVYDPGGPTGMPPSFVYPTLPWTADAVPARTGTCGWAVNLGNSTLKKDRLLVTLFARTGQIVTGSLENYLPTDPNAPYYDAQRGIREAK